MPARRIPWTEVEREYVEAPDTPDAPTCEALAKKYGCAAQSVLDRAWKGGWTDKRARWRRQQEEVRRQIVMREQAEAVARFDASAIALARAALARCERLVAEDDGIRPPLAPAAIGALASAVLALQDVVHSAAGTPGEREAVRQAAERLGKVAGKAAVITMDELAYYSEKARARDKAEAEAAKRAGRAQRAAKRSEAGAEAGEQ